MNQNDLSGRLARWSLKLQGSNFEIQLGKGAQNIVPSISSRMHMDELQVNERMIDVCLDSPCFKSEEYLELKKSMIENQNRLPNVCIGMAMFTDAQSFTRGQSRSGSSLKAAGFMVTYKKSLQGY